MSKSKQHDRKRRAHRWMVANGFTSNQNRLTQSLAHVATLRKQELRTQIESTVTADDFERRCRAEGL